MYNNDLFGDEGDVLAFVDDRSRANTITEQPSAAPQKQQFNSPKLQQQKTVAGRRRIQRLQAGGITVSNTTLSPKARPGSVRRPFGGGAYNPQTMSRAPAAGESAPATTAVNQKSTKSAVAVPVFTPVATPIAVTESGAKNNRLVPACSIKNPWSAWYSSCFTLTRVGVGVECCICLNCDDGENQNNPLQ